MIPVETVLFMSLLVKDAGGHHPLKAIDRDGAVAIAAECAREPDPDEYTCAGMYLVQSFRESGWRFFAIGDCVDHLWDSASDEYKRTHPKYYQPDASGHCRSGDGEPTSFGPFQERRQPKTWAEAVATFARTLRRAEEICAHYDGYCTSLGVAASGKAGSKEGERIARARLLEADRIVAETLFADDPRQATSSFTTTMSLSSQ